jgi:hypothetical protein
MSIFFILSIASTTRFALTGSGSPHRPAERRRDNLPPQAELVLHPAALLFTAADGELPVKPSLGGGRRNWRRSMMVSGPTGGADVTEAITVYTHFG